MSESSCLIAPESEGGDGCSSPRGHFRPLKIAILGTRGIPASYGGFETFAQEISHELVQRGHSVVVYCRRPFLKSTAEELAEYNGVELRYVPTFYHKYLETVVHSLFSFVHVLLNPVDIVLLCNAANSPWSFLAKLRGIPVAVNLDGIERKRGKWNLFGRTWYSLGEICSVWFARELVADAEVIASYYKDRYAADSHVIAYGARCRRSSATQVVSELGLKPQNYLLYVSRLEPENNALGVIEAYSRVQTNVPLVIVGDAPYADEYKAKLRAAADERVVFAGYQFGSAYHELQSNAYAYIQATEVGGTHPALVEAMAYGNCVIANGTPENHEVLGDAGLYYERNQFEQLADLMRHVLADPGAVQAWGVKAQNRAAAHYTWEKVATQYEELFNYMTCDYEYASTRTGHRQLVD